MLCSVISKNHLLYRFNEQFNTLRYLLTQFKKQNNSICKQIRYKFSKVIIFNTMSWEIIKSTTSKIIITQFQKWYYSIGMIPFWSLRIYSTAIKHFSIPFNSTEIYNSLRISWSINNLCGNDHQVVFTDLWFTSPDYKLIIGIIV